MNGALIGGEIFVSLKTYSHSELAVHRQHPRDPSAATHSHTFGEGDLGRHHESQFDRVTLRDLKIGVKKCSAATQVLGKPATFPLCSGQPHGDRKLKMEALRGAAFEMDLIGAHDFSAGRVPNNSASNRLLYSSLATRGSRKLRAQGNSSFKPKPTPI